MNPYMIEMSKRAAEVDELLRAALFAIDESIKLTEKLPPSATAKDFPPYALCAANSTWGYITREKIVEALNKINFTGKKYE